MLWLRLRVLSTQDSRFRQQGDYKDFVTRLGLSSKTEDAAYQQP